jgi:hypothetical protein
MVSIIALNTIKVMGYRATIAEGQMALARGLEQAGWTEEDRGKQP